MEFIFNEVLQVQDSEIPGYKDLDNDFLKSILNEAGKICSDILFPLNHVGDNQGCSLENGIVRTPEALKKHLIKSEKMAGQRLTVIQNTVGKAFHILLAQPLEK